MGSPHTQMDPAPQSASVVHPVKHWQFVWTPAAQYEFGVAAQSASDVQLPPMVQVTPARGMVLVHCTTSAR